MFLTKIVLYSYILYIMRNVSQWKTTSNSFINTRSFMSLLDNHQLKIVTNIQITKQWYQIRMTTIQEGTQVCITHVGQSHPAKTFNGSHPLNVFAEQPILNAWKGSRCQRHYQISEKGSTNIVYGSNVSTSEPVCV